LKFYIKLIKKRHYLENIKEKLLKNSHEKMKNTHAKTIKKIHMKKLKNTHAKTIKKIHMKKLKNTHAKTIKKI
jgi:hypothetical protein